MGLRPLGQRWYGRVVAHKDEPGGRVQIDGQLRDAASGRRPLRIREEVLRLAQAEYDRQHPGQPYERMQERGGLGLLEVVGLLADLAERHGALPSLPSPGRTEHGWKMPPDPSRAAPGD